jgi:hypothetical protein
MIHKNKILPPLSQALTTHHPNFFTLIVTLSEGRASIGWVPYDKMLFVPSYIKQFSLPPKRFSLYFYSPTALPDSLPLLHFSSIYLLHFQTRYLLFNLPLPEGRVGNVCEPLLPKTDITLR